MLSLDATWLADLPIGCTIELGLFGGGITALVCTDANAYAMARAEGRTVMTGSELGALALAARHGRLTPQTARRWLERKAAEPAWRLDAREALGGAQREETSSQRWPLSRVFTYGGLTLVGLTITTPTGEQERL